MRRVAATAVAAVLLAWPAAAREAPRPPCDAQAPSVPAYAAPDEPARAEVWSPKPLDDPGLPNVRLHAGGPPEGPGPAPGCTGWAAFPPFTVAVAARFRHAGGADALLQRFAAVAALRGVTYWAAARRRWEPLFDDAYAVTDPDTRARRPDFTGDELRPGRDLYAYQDIGGPVGGAVFRMRAREAGPDRLVVELENATSARVAGLFPLRPGALRSLHFFERGASGDEWAYYGLTGLDASPDSARTYVNRAAALLRHLAGVPPERDPPVWP